MALTTKAKPWFLRIDWIVKSGRSIPDHSLETSAASVTSEKAIVLEVKRTTFRLVQRQTFVNHMYW